MGDNDGWINPPDHLVIRDGHQILNEKQHQNLNNLFYDIGGRVSKYDDRLQQIVPAANQLDMRQLNPPAPHRDPNTARPGLASPSRKPQCCCAASDPQ